MLALAFVVASRSWAAAILAVAYLLVTMLAAVRTEEAALEQRFEGQYSAYREGRLPQSRRHFALGRVVANREYRTVAGLAAVALLLYLRSIV